MRFQFGEATPRLGRDVFVAPTASVIGNVTLGDEVSVWFGAVLRGDVGSIVVGERSNIQDGTVVHVTAGARGTRIGRDVVIGHRALVHECWIDDEALLGMGCILLDGVHIGRGAIVAAGAVVREGQQIPSRAVVAGVPAEVRKILPESSLETRRQHARHYVALARRYLRGEAAAL
jgi:carbonic anhydrase/acetyltransferase-like protein (isoleucine patch superfamily)